MAMDWHAFHDGLRVRQQREGLRITRAGTNEELDMIVERMDLFWGQEGGGTAFALRREEATVMTTVTDALSAKARKPSPGLEGVNDLTSDPRQMRHECMMMRCPPAQPTMMTDWTGTAETRSAPLSTDAGVGTD